MDMDIFGNDMVVNNNQQFNDDDVLGGNVTNNKTSNNLNLMDDDLLGGTEYVLNNPHQQIVFDEPINAVQQEKKSETTLDALGVEQYAGLDLLGSPLDLNSNKNIILEAYKDSNLEISFDCCMTNGDTAKIDASFENLTSTQIKDVKMQIAVKKYLKLTLNQPNGDVIPPFSSNLKQTLTVQNTAQGEKPISLAVRLKYIIGDKTVEKTNTVSSFPLSF